MNCPYCNQKLIKGSKRRYETLCEHVSVPNKKEYPLRNTYICISYNCPCSNEDLFWDEHGELYGFNRSFNFKDDISSAYPSFSRKMDIEIYKKGLKDKTMLSPLLMFNCLQPYIEHNYKADEYGNVLKKSYKLRFLKKNESGEYTIDYIFPFKLIMFGISFTYDIIKRHKTYPDNKYIIKELKDAFVLHSWDNRLYRKVEKKLLKIIFYKYAKRVHSM